MPRTQAQNELKKQESRARLLEAATRVFAATGYAGARMADITREAGVSHGLAFHYFPNKEAMFTAVVEATMGYASDMTLATASEDGSTIDKLEHLCSQMLQGAQKHPAHAAIMMQASTSSTVPSKARDILRCAAEEIHATMAGLISQTQDGGHLAAGEPLMLARTLLATLSGLALSPTSDHQPATFPPLDVVMRILGPSGRR